MTEIIIKDNFLITPPEKNHWLDIAELIASSIPSALVSKLGKRFGALYYEKISNYKFSCCYAAFEKSDRLAGIIIGTLDRNSAKDLDFTFKCKLLFAANLRLLKPSVLRWFRSESQLQGRKKYKGKDFPIAELIILSVHEEFKGNRIASKLINELESFFKENNLDKPYLILTEKSNRAANNFYEKIGAKFIKTYPYHDKIINAWHKSLP